MTRNCAQKKISVKKDLCGFVWCAEYFLYVCPKVFKVSHAHIAIRSVGEKPVEPECGGRTLYLEFDDVVPEGEGLDESAKWMSLDQAFRVIEFVKEVEEPLIVVNCEAGISRSSGVVLALRRVFGGDVEEVLEKARPNTYVAALVERAFELKLKGERKDALDGWG